MLHVSVTRAVNHMLAMMHPPVVKGEKFGGKNLNQVSNFGGRGYFGGIKLKQKKIENNWMFCLRGRKG